MAKSTPPAPPVKSDLPRDPSKANGVVNLFRSLGQMAHDAPDDYAELFGLDVEPTPPGAHFGAPDPEYQPTEADWLEYGQWTITAPAQALDHDLEAFAEGWQRQAAQHQNPNGVAYATGRAEGLAFAAALLRGESPADVA